MKKMIAALSALLIIAASLSGCMSTAKTISENGAAAYISVKCEKEVTLAADKDGKVLLASYKNSTDSSSVAVQKSETEFDGIEFTGKTYQEGIKAIISKLGDKKLVITIKAGGVTTDAAKEALGSVKKEVPELVKELTDVTVTFVEKGEGSNQDKTTELFKKSSDTSSDASSDTSSKAE